MQLNTVASLVRGFTKCAPPPPVLPPPGGTSLELGLFGVPLPGSGHCPYLVPGTAPTLATAPPRLQTLPRPRRTPSPASFGSLGGSMLNSLAENLVMCMRTRFSAREFNIIAVEGHANGVETHVSGVEGHINSVEARVSSREARVSGHHPLPPLPHPNPSLLTVSMSLRSAIACPG